MSRRAREIHEGGALAGSGARTVRGLPRPIIPPVGGPGGALSAVLAALREDGCGPQLGAPQGTGWSTLPAAFDRRAERFAEGLQREGDRRVAASFLAAGYVEVPTVLLGAPWVLAGVHVVTAPAQLRVHRHDAGWFDRTAIDAPRVRGAPDPEATAAAIVAHVQPLATALVEELPIGRAAVWGTAADALGWHVAWVARRTGADPATAWTRLTALLNAVAVHLGHTLVRPTALPVVWSGGTRWFSRRGTCCLAYRRHPDADPAGEGYCTTCPLRPESVAYARLLSVLERTTDPTT